MPQTESSSVSLTRPSERDGVECAVVRLSGEHDAATRVAVAAVIDRAVDLDDCDVIVDLHSVTFMDASIVGVLVGARNRLERRGRSLWIYQPSLSAAWVLGLTGAKALAVAPVSAVRLTA